MSLTSRFNTEPSVPVQIAVRALVLIVTALILSPIFINDVSHYWDVGKVVSFDTLPYRDFLWEFPPLTTVLLLLVPLSGHSHGLFTPMFIAVMVLFEVLTWRVTRSMLDDEARAHAHWYWLVTMVPLSSIAYFRLDWPATLFGAIALFGILQTKARPTVLGILAGFAVKMWTVVYVATLVGLKRFKQAALAVASCLALVGLWYAFSPSGLESFLDYRKGSGFQIESIPGSLVMLFGSHESFFQYGALMVDDSGWSWLQATLPGLFVVVAALTVLLMWKRPVNVVAVTGALVLLLMLTSRLLSPQYLVWLAPFVVLLLRTHKAQAVAFAVAIWLTLIEIQYYEEVTDGVLAGSLVVVVRNLALVVVLAFWTKLALRQRNNEEALAI